jgi:hypothetical protein
MKKLLLTGAAWMTCICVYAQNAPMQLSTVKERLKAANRHAPVKPQEVISGNELPLKNVNSTVVKPASQTTNLNSKSSSVPPEIIGNSTYDLQTNGSVQDRIYNAGGTLGATWTWSTDLGGTYPDRGPGYNYYDGTSWGPLPTTSITTDRRGWPNIARLANGGEVIVSHANVTTTTALSARPVAGTGTWTQTPLPTFPGGEPTLWARTAAGGPDGNTLHMIDISYPTGNGGALVNGLDGCLNYSRSLDGGVNWDIVRALPPNVNDQEYFGFRADGYAIDSKDNTVAFVSGDISDDWALWKSTDNGSNWTRTVIMDFPFTKYDDATQITDVDGDGIADTLLTTDGSYAIVLDQNGMVHAFAGAMLIIDDDPTGLLGLFLSTDGLLYWNESMGANPPVVVATAPDLDGSGQADAFAADLGGRYGNDGICSMPSAGMDAAGNIYLSYCPLIEGTDSGNPSPLAFSFRNVYLKASSDGGATWTSGYNVSNSLFDEGVFNSVAKIVDNCVHMVYQQDGAPGYSVPPNGEHPIGNNDFIYDCVDVNLVLSSVNENLTPEVSVSLYPNPASDFVALNYTVTKAVDISVEVRNIMGQLVGTYTKKADVAGSHILSIDVSKYSSGMYTVNTILNNEVYSSRFVKN